jgi:hypothetical protein
MKNTFTWMSALIIFAAATLAAQTTRIDGAGATFPAADRRAAHESD